MIMFSTEDECNSFRDAMLLQDANKQKEAMYDEIKSIRQNNTWTLTELPPKH